ncbi:TetR/AcrR family transcriptional regulator [Baekduia soli]|uniref:TetR/AcrR family transcriptional regulator n=1 Tax=Baekduia soli TaxID=496014 RepID=A0A5B8UBE6_9ACTN|nr:TetR/AcrR family transcriptional regulator [Baekduia soli]QEC50337.1 TetR/AcrR family transcriptional regulator [Baekduia soli]
MSTDATPADRPLRRDAERNRQRILQAAAELFAEAGLDVTLDEVARRAGVGVGTVYRRFPVKEELIDALFEDRIAGIVSLAEEALAHEDPWTGFTHFMERACERHTADRGLQQIVFSSVHGRQRVAAVRERIKPLVLRILERAQADGSLRADVESTDIPLLQFMVGAAGIYATDVAPEVWRRMLPIVLDGLRAERRGVTPLATPALSQEQFEQTMRCARL